MTSKIKCIHCGTQRTDWCKSTCDHYTGEKVIVKAEKKTIQKPPKPAERTYSGRTPQPVYCVDTNTWYESAKAASEYTPAKEECIRKACTGRQSTAGGLRWITEDGIIKGEMKRSCHPNSRRPGKKVRNIETNAEYESITEAAKDLKIGLSTASRYASKKYKGKRILEYVEVQP